MHTGRFVRSPFAGVGTWRALLCGFGTLAVGDGMARVPGIIAILVLARRLAPTDFGVVILGLTLMAWFALLVDCGTETLGTRNVSRRPERLREITEPILGLRLALSVAGMVLLGGVSWAVASRPGEGALLGLFAAALPATALNLRTMVLGVNATTALALGNIASQTLFLVGVVVLVRGAEDVVWVPMLKAASELTYAVLILAALRHRFGLLRPRLDLELWITTLRQSVPLFINGLARAVMMSSGLLLIGVAVDRHAVGLYAAAHRPVMVAAAVSGFLLVSFLASYSAAGRDVSTQIFRRTVWLGAAAAPLALAVSIASGPLVTLVYGASYAAAAPVLALLIWAVPITLAGGPYGIALIAANHQTRLLRNNVLGAAFTVAATLAVVPATGIAGAAAVVVAAQALVVVLNYATSVPLGVAPALGVVLFAPARARRAA